MVLKHATPGALEKLFGKGYNPDEPPIQPVYPIEAALAALTGGEALFAVRAMLAEEEAADGAGTAIENALQAIKDYLGGPPDRLITNDSGDIVMMRGDQKIRFDINNPGNDAPHFHIQERNPDSSAPNKWIDSGNQHRYYFRED